ncbi:MAG: hypothetical protein PVJ88_17240, partial [Desulfobacterales bacterium]
GRKQFKNFASQLTIGATERYSKLYQLARYDARALSLSTRRMTLARKRLNGGGAWRLCAFD